MMSQAGVSTTLSSLPVPVPLLPRSFRHACMCNCHARRWLHAAGTAPTQNQQSALDTPAQNGYFEGRSSKFAVAACATDASDSEPSSWNSHHAGSSMPLHSAVRIITEEQQQGEALSTALQEPMSVPQSRSGARGDTSASASSCGTTGPPACRRSEVHWTTRLIVLSFHLPTFFTHLLACNFAACTAGAA